MSEVAWLAEMIVGDFYDDRLDMASRNMARAGAWASMPEAAAAVRLLCSGASNRTLRLFLTFVSAMDYARDSDRLWRDGLALFESRP